MTYVLFIIALAIFIILGYIVINRIRFKKFSGKVINLEVGKKEGIGNNPPYTERIFLEGYPNHIFAMIPYPRLLNTEQFQSLLNEQVTLICKKIKGPQNIVYYVIKVMVF